MEIKNTVYPAEKQGEFPWDDKVLNEFKNLIKDQGIKCRMDDIFLLGILRARKFDLQRSIKMLKNYYNVRTEYPQYFQNLLPSKMENALKMNSFQFLPKPDQHGRFILVNRVTNWDPSVVSVNDTFRTVLLHSDMMLNFHRTQVNSVAVITDAVGVGLSHFLYVTPSFLVSTVKVLLRDTYPLRYAEMHYVNLNIIMKAVLSIIVPLLPAKLKARLHFHSDMSTLHEFISPEYLPEEYGGKLPPFDTTEVNNMLKANEEFFRKNEEYVNSYKEERNKNFTEGKFRYVGEEEDENLKKFIEKSEENYKCYSKDPEAFVNALKKDTGFEITHF